jgi:hypothetical protein
MRELENALAQRFGGIDPSPRQALVAHVMLTQLNQYHKLVKRRSS